MPPTTVHIPQDLWDELRALPIRPNMSQLCIQAIRQQLPQLKADAAVGVADPRDDLHARIRANIEYYRQQRELPAEVAILTAHVDSLTLRVEQIEERFADLQAVADFARAVEQDAEGG